MSIDSLLEDILTSIDDGSAFIKVKPKKAKAVNIALVPRKVHKFHKPSLEPINLVLIVNVSICTCCGAVHNSSTKNLLVEKEDKWGNKHFTSFITPSNINELPRRKEFITVEVPACEDCFDEAIIKPVTSDDAEKNIVSVEEFIGTAEAKARKVSGEDDGDGEDKEVVKKIEGKTFEPKEEGDYDMDGLDDILAYAEACMAGDEE